MARKSGYPGFILFWLSQTVSQLGSAMTGFALIIYAFKQTGSAMTVSLLSFCTYLPYILVSLFSGAAVDRARKKTVMLMADLGAFICSVAVLVLFRAGTLEIWHIYVVNAVIGAMNAFQSPARAVAIGILVPKDKLSNASGMNSFADYGVQIAAPALAGTVSSFFGLSAVIALDMATFLLAFITLLAFISIPEERMNEGAKPRAFDGLSEGVRFLKNDGALFGIILFMAALNFFSRLTYENILPAMILARSGGSDTAYGIVSAVLGVGGVVGGLVVSLDKKRRDPVKQMFLAAALSFLFGDMLLALGRGLPLWCVAAVCASLPIPFISAGQNVILYSRVPKEMQGRVFSVRNAIQFASIPLGIILGGFLADGVFEPLLEGSSALAAFLRMLVGEGKGSGMAAMFLTTGTLGSLTSLLALTNRKLKALSKALAISNEQQEGEATVCK